MVDLLDEISIGSEPARGQVGWAPEPQHFDGLVGGETISTRELLRTEEALERAIRKRSIVAIYGRAGLGKTFAIRSVLKKLGSDDIVPFWVEFDRKPTLREIARTLYIGIFGEEPQGNRARIVDEVIAGLEEIASRSIVVLVIDEAQRLNRDCLEQLRRIHEMVPSGFALVVAGGNDCWKVIRSEPMLRSRITRPVHFKAMSESSMLKIMPQFHPIYEGIEPEVLSSINASYAHGNFRNWVSFTSTAADYLDKRRNQSLDLKFARKVTAILNGD